MWRYNLLVSAARFKDSQIWSESQIQFLFALVLRAWHVGINVTCHFYYDVVTTTIGARHGQDVT